MSASEPLPASRDALVEVLARHDYLRGLGACRCGWEGNEAYCGFDDRHRAHVADALLASGILRDPSTLADGITAEARKYAVLRAAGFGLKVSTVSVAQLPDIIAAALSEEPT